MYKPRGQNFGQFWHPPLYVDTFTKELLLSVVVIWATPLVCPRGLYTPPDREFLEFIFVILEKIMVILLKKFWALVVNTNLLNETKVPKNVLSENNFSST